ncbi:MAG: helix-turn-helix domain-containing protein [Lachnospiraceae bacterium]
MNHSNILGDKLRELRKAHSFTQDYVASALGIARQTYSHYETGKRKPDAETLYKLAGLYNISVSDLMHLTMVLDRNIYFDAPAPTQSSEDLAGYLEFFNSPMNQKKFKYHTNPEKELLYYFDKLSEDDKRDIIEFIKIKARRKK